jgi:hypothetical protein
VLSLPANKVAETSKIAPKSGVNRRFAGGLASWVVSCSGTLRNPNDFDGRAKGDKNARLCHKRFDLVLSGWKEAS